MKEATPEQIVAFLGGKRRNPEELMNREELLAELRWQRERIADLEAQLLRALGEKGS
jgi:hypothetical protein